ncbi:MAG: phosphoribosylformylglycinamidine synthase I [Planctomycetota bacterium]
MSIVKAMVLRTAGTNCDYETAYALEMAGATAERVHINRLAEKPELLEEYAILAVPGGFSYGDDVAAGRILAVEMIARLGDALRKFVEHDGLVIGICNGFQVLVKTGLLPGAGLDAGMCTLTDNDCRRFYDGWVYLRCLPSRSLFTLGRNEVMRLPVAHAEGKFVARNSETLDTIAGGGQVALQYCDEFGAAARSFPANPNGSQLSIAGICDDTGQVLGMMPHPERYVFGRQGPDWTRGELPPDHGDGLGIFRNAVAAARV